jgi:predicted PurR-regulated permease PerM
VEPGGPAHDEGALLGVPAAAFLKVLLEDYYRQSRFYREG